MSEFNQNGFERNHQKAILRFILTRALRKNRKLHKKNLLQNMLWRLHMNLESLLLLKVPPKHMKGWIQAKNFHWTFILTLNFAFFILKPTKIKENTFMCFGITFLKKIGFVWSCHSIFLSTFFCEFFDFFCVVKTHSLFAIPSPPPYL